MECAALNGHSKALPTSQQPTPAVPEQQVVSLCVGGTTFTTTVGTLTAVPGSYLSILFGSSSQWQPSSVLPGSQTPFIDRDGQLFSHVLAYLRTVRDGSRSQLLLLPDNPLQLQQLKAEAEFYGLPGLATICSLSRGGAQHAGVWSRLAALHQQQQQQSHQQQPLLWGPQHQVQQQEQQGSLTHRDPVSSADVQLDVSAQQQDGSSSSMSLAAAMLQAQQVLGTQQHSWAQDATLQQYADLVLRHLVQLPLAAQQPDLVAVLAAAEAGSRLEFRFAYYPVGDVRIDIQCRTLPCNADQASAIAAAAAAAGAGAGVAAGSPSPNASLRDSRQQQTQQQQVQRRSTVTGVEGTAADGAYGGGAAGGIGSGRAYSGSLPAEAAGVAAVAAAAAAAAAVSSYAGAAVMPGPGWGSVTTYHRYTIKEASDKFVLTTHSPGEAQQVQEVLHTTYRPELKRYSGLHKLCVQQCPRRSVAGLVWVLEQSGFSSVQLSTSLETYYVGRNTFTGFIGVITCSL